MQRKNPRRSADGEHGIALVGVLCVVSLLTVLAVGALEATRRYGQLAHRSFEVAQASELADSAIRVAVLELTSQQERAAAQVPNSVTVRVFGQSVAVQLEREARRVDLNAADETVLAAALASNGVEDGDARVLAARIVDWRDIDDAAGLHGAERAEYRRAGRNSGPRNSAFETVSELRQVLSAENMEDEALDAFTVYSHLREPQDQGLAEQGAPASEVVRMSACATVERVNVCRTAIVRFTGNRVRPVLVYSWSTRRARTARSN